MSRRIVVAEDEAAIRINLTRLLGLEGYAVYAAPDGAEGWRLVQEHLPDLVLSDVMMPNMSGHELVRCLRADPLTAHIPVVLLTAKADRGDVREGMNLGADDYLTKPFQRDELLACLQAQLDKAETRQLAARRAAEQAHHLAHFDPLTRLPNRGHFLLLLAHTLAAHRGREAAWGLWAFGLNQQGALAQALGSAGYDRCIQTLAHRLQAVATLTDRGLPGSLARVAGDVLVLFAAVDAPVLEPARAEAIGRELLDTLRTPVRIGDQEHFVDLSVGVGLGAVPDEPAEALLARAEMALADARAQRLRPVVVHTPGTGQAASVGWRLHNDLHRALERDELQVVFQPQVRAADGGVVGFEALMRWRHAGLGMVRPDQFIPIAESNGCIVPMGAWVLRQACREAMRWSAALPAGAPAPRVAVNLSLRQFGDPGLVEQVRAALADSGLPAQRLELEITESTAMLELQHTLEVLRQLKALGLALAIDDFGTGYSSLAYLKRFPLDVLKIDQSFVRQLCHDADDQAIARSVVHLAHALGLSVIAEGVETADQHRLLQTMGCEEMQGWLHGKPMPADQVPGWLAAHRPALGPG
ncbi:putative bifunctional diguanylate cyclase/phosphodiesterase [Piscinibacter sakaiensis]|uniref:Diguanylate cyclase/phosphodiesterase with PAS/PAC sensor(S) n=1 Tax=Piscinibacter sakaiensis TaxID=1547922 RepID=A0A0K8P7C9_PISS1|nr:EAL domain-containing protein [Piscinibacter sakaiensis]GAP38531.1 diguanylate cyclase/phosphodiesterase with PAS/PAC sensor(s) [Piscinibacter sakaiensis]